MKNSTIIMNKEDIKSGPSALHPDLWYHWLETLGVDSDATEVCLELSSMDENKKAD